MPKRKKICPAHRNVTSTSWMKYPLLFLLVFPFIAVAQPGAKRDSLLQLARSASTDTTRIWALMEAGKLYTQAQPDTALGYFAQALAQAEKSSFERGIAKCRINRSAAFNNLGRYQEAIADCQVAIPICTRLRLQKELVAIYNNMGNAWDFLGSRWQAIDCFSKALEVMKNVALPPNFPLTVRNNLARQYNDLRLFDKGFAYGQESLREAESLGDSIEIAYALHVMAYATICLNRDEEALGYCRRIERIARDGEPLLRVFALHNLAVLTYDKAPLQAENLAREALAVSRGAGDAFGETSALWLLARFALYRKDYRAAQVLADQSMAKARSVQLNDEIANVLLTQSDLALLGGNTTLYRELRQQYHDMKDTLAGSALILATQELETRYESEKKPNRSCSWNRNGCCSNCACAKKTASSSAFRRCRRCCCWPDFCCCATCANAAGWPNRRSKFNNNKLQNSNRNSNSAWLMPCCAARRTNAAASRATCTMVSVVCCLASNNPSTA